MFTFTLKKTDKFTRARLGEIETPHGKVATPVFMTIGTAGAVKAITPEEVKQLGGQMILGNTYHLHLRPGEDTIAKHGGLHQFINFDGPILTDSGGYQVFSLSKINKVTFDGIRFQSHLDGEEIYLTPEKSIEIQQKLGADIIMCLDECAPYPCDPKYAEQAVARTTAWAKLCKRAHKTRKQALFGIVQGSVYPDLRERSAKELLEFDFPGYAIGGLAVGENTGTMYDMVEITAPLLPADKPRYLMGVGKPENILEAVARGIDMFDCVLPTRNARHGYLYTSHGVIHIKNAEYKEDTRPLDKNCDCPVCASYTRSYLRHIFMADEPLAQRLLTIHNLRFYLKLMQDIRFHLQDGTFKDFYQKTKEKLKPRPPKPKKVKRK